MGHLYRRGDVWWVKYYRNGRPIRESARTTKETEARRFLKQREGATVEGRPIIPRAERLRVEDLLADLLNDYRINDRRSLDRTELSVRHLREFFDGRRALDVTTSDVRAYVAGRQEADAANGTINRELAALKRAFNLAVKAEKLLRRPHIPMLDENNVRTGFFGEVEFLALHESLPEYARLPVAFYYTYGWRKSEILNLTWPRVDLAAGTVRLEPGTTKNSEGRTVVLTEDLRDRLAKQWAVTVALVRQRKPDATPREVVEAVPFVFHRKGKQIKGFRKVWLTACRKAGLVGRIPHDFRRTAVRNMVRAGIPERVAMTITGHKTRSVFERYNIVSEGDLREAAKRLGGVLTGTISGTVEGDATTSAEVDVAKTKG
jgi:integrase